MITRDYLFAFLFAFLLIFYVVYDNLNILLKESPPTIAEIGKCTWTLLHTIANRYPIVPTHQQKDKMTAFLNALGDFYPCGQCAYHLRVFLVDNPPDVSSKKNLEIWMCNLHNSVNTKLGKPIFFCENLESRYTFTDECSKLCKSPI